MLVKGVWPIIFGLSMSCPLTVVADTDEDVANQKLPPPDSSVGEAEVVIYPAQFFEQYQPQTALEMIKQLPGFQINDGDNLRGFNKAGNILINDERPSAKQDLASDILSRIPAATVDRIELIRGQVQKIDLQGHSIVANVVLRENILPANRWEIFMTYTSVAPLGLGGGFSSSDKWRDIDYNFGLDLSRDTNGISGVVDVSDIDNNLTEVRSDTKEQTGLSIRGIYLNASALLGETLYHLNTKVGGSKSDQLEISRRTPLTPGDSPHDIHFVRTAQQSQFELGLDGGRLLRQDIHGKAILLLTHKNRRLFSSQESFDISGDQFRFRQADERAVTTEGIARLELDWSGWANHAVKFNFEGAYNVLDNTLVQTDDTGGGPVVVDVPGANSRVEETRGDILLKDTWSLNQWILDYRLGVEVSTITQTGDAEQERSFFFLKPQGSVIYSPSQHEQTRLRLAREVGQLDFSDFVSTTVFVEDDLALGNPNLKPESTWIAEISHERRFDELGVVTLTAFHHWISDAEDLLPVTDKFEVPGNIGDGRRWGLEMDSTIPLTWLNLKGARLDIRMRWQNSSVTDPVTGKTRELSANGGFSGPPTIHFRSENEYVMDIAFRQDFVDSGWAWGWDTAFQAERLLFKVNELENFEEGVEFNAFVETTRWLGLKIRFEGNNLLNYLELRDRLIFTGRRELTPVQRRELRQRIPSRLFTITISGSY